ncbi:hypothetical protein HZB06_00010 [Candidatus Wolfebacteria bacterium]|nr:hypothetical protein [Candidatus Wolfebacteria bacterium]
MLKTITKSAIFSSLVLGLASVTNQVALAAAKCTVNGQEVDCAELGNKVKGILGGELAASFLFLRHSPSNSVLDYDDCPRRTSSNQ